MIVVVGIFSKSTFSQDENNNGYQFTDQIRLETTSVKDQHKSGTCWCFATVSFLETELLRMGKQEYDLSEMYLVRHTYMQKAKDYVKFHGHNNFGQGGQAHDAMIELEQHGIVPEKVYPGTEYGTEKHVHNEVASVLDNYVETLTGNRSNTLTPVWTEGYAKILDTYFGEVPEQYNYKNESYTPKSFLNELGINTDNYIELTSFTHHPWYKAFDLEVPDNWAHKRYYNLPLNELVEVMDHSLESGYSVVWDGDVSNRGFSHAQGIAVVPSDDNASFRNHPVEEKEIIQANRQIQFLNQTMTDDHLMHITGIGNDKEGKKYYLTKNSWGPKSNNYGGFLYMSEPYIRLNTIAIMVHKDAIPEDIKEKTEL
ncbi:MAG: C1 family peptidase [Bacteroidales bacterium]|nr:C1 family peptidase [Bacteroidales bacterium]